MRFLVIAEQAEHSVPSGPEQIGGFIQNVMLPSARMLEQWEQQGKGKGGVFVGERKGMMVVDAASAEELDQMITSLPFWPMMRWEVHALLTQSEGISRMQRLIEQMRPATGR